jgi:hypothetical protein
MCKLYRNDGIEVNLWIIIIIIIIIHKLFIKLPTDIRQLLNADYVNMYSELDMLFSCFQTVYPYVACYVTETLYAYQICFLGSVDVMYTI